MTNTITLIIFIVVIITIGILLITIFNSNKSDSEPVVYDKVIPLISLLGYDKSFSVPNQTTYIEPIVEPTVETKVNPLPDDDNGDLVVSTQLINNIVIGKGYHELGPLYINMLEYPRSNTFRTGGKEIPVHSWYKYDNINMLKKDKNAWNQYLEDREQGQSHFLYDWTEVKKIVMPLLGEKIEYIGIIKAKKDKKTLYVDKMEASLDTHVDKLKENYYMTIPDDIATKYMNIPCYFMFHTHPISKYSDPYPSDIDLYTALDRSLLKMEVGAVLFSEYGVMVYYLHQKRITEITKKGGNLAFQTYCYDLLLAWNSFDSLLNTYLEDRINIIKKFGITMILIPSTLYLSINTFHPITSRYYDKHILQKYEFLEHVKSLIKKYTYESNKKNIK